MILMEMTLEYELEEYDEKEKEKVDPLINIIQWKQWNTCKHSKIEKVKCLKNVDIPLATPPLAPSRKVAW